MERIQVDLHAWSDIDRAGGLVLPHGDPLNWWKVAKIHRRYVAPAVKPGDVDEHGNVAERSRFQMRAYLVDLDGSDALDLDDYYEVLLHQVPRVGWWYLKQVDESHLERIERYRVE